MDARQRRRFVALVAALAVVAVACGGGSSKKSSTGTTVASDSGTPVTGGKVVYGVESDTGGGYCLPSGQLAISGVMVADSVYDPLTWPNEKGEYVPYLAESVTPNADSTEWTIKLRQGITFTDGTPLDAETVKLNLDTYRGKNPNISSALFSLVLRPIADVTVTDPSTVVVKMSQPWVAFPAYLFSFGRLGIMAKAQLADKQTCPRNLIGTGPFKLKGTWTPGTPVELVKNAHYWRKDAKGRQLPYLDAITFVGVVESAQRITQLEAGQLDLMHTHFEPDLDQLEQKAKSGDIKLSIGDKGRENRYYLLNAGRAPFNDPKAREAFALALDRQAINKLRNLGRATVADGPFDKGVMGYVADPGFPKHDLAKAKKLVDEVKAAHGGQFKVTFVILPDSENRNEAELLKQQIEQAGITAEITTVDQTAEISTAISGDYDVLLWRNHAGEDPDTGYTWWHSGELTNFGKINDPLIDKYLEQGRTTSDPAQRAAAYEGITKEFAKNIWNVWAWYVDWGIATSPRVHGVLGPPLPDGSAPFPILAGLHPTAGLWVSK
ncbi:MAG: ABC transporter substrate-binding protein [Acidimicrobiia bacterium]